MLSRGLPVRHHVVVYTHARLSDPLCSSQLQASLRLDETEVSAATWLTRSMVSAIVSILDDEEAECQHAAVSHRSCDVDFPNTIELVWFFCWFLACKLAGEESKGEMEGRGWTGEDYIDSHRTYLMSALGRG